MSLEKYLKALNENTSFTDIVYERELTKAELEKREEVAQVMEREDPNIDMSKKMATATSVAKKVLYKEEVELEEAVNTEKKKASLEKKIKDKTDALGLAREQRRMKGGSKGVQGAREIKLASEISALRSELYSLNEDVEQIDEISHDHLLNYAHDAEISSRHAITNHQRATRKVKQALNKGDHEEAKIHQDIADKIKHKYNKRIQGIEKATNKLSKEYGDNSKKLPRSEYSGGNKESSMDKARSIYDELEDKSDRNVHHHLMTRANLSPKSAHEYLKHIKKTNRDKEYGNKLLTKEDIEQIDEVNSPFKSAGHQLEKHAEKLGKDHMDYEDFKSHASLLKSGNPSDWKTSAESLRHLDTGARDTILQHIDKHVNKRKEMAAAYYKASGHTKIKEDVELDESTNNFISTYHNTKLKKEKETLRKRGMVDQAEKLTLDDIKKKYPVAVREETLEEGSWIDARSCYDGPGKGKEMTKMSEAEHADAINHHKTQMHQLRTGTHKYSKMYDKQELQDKYHYHAHKAALHKDALDHHQMYNEETVIEAVSDSDKEILRARGKFARPELEKTKEVTRHFDGEKGAKRVEHGYRSVIKRDYKKMDKEEVKEGYEELDAKEERKDRIRKFIKKVSKATPKRVPGKQTVQNEEIELDEAAKDLPTWKLRSLVKNEIGGKENAEELARRQKEKKAGTYKPHSSDKAQAGTKDPQNFREEVEIDEESEETITHHAHMHKGKSYYSQRKDGHKYVGMAGYKKGGKGGTYKSGMIVQHKDSGKYAVGNISDKTVWHDKVEDAVAHAHKRFKMDHKNVSADKVHVDYD